MFIFSRDGETVINSDNIKRFEVAYDVSGYNIMADDYYVDSYTIKDDAKKQLEEIFRQIASGATRYDLR